MADDETLDSGPPDPHMRRPMTAPNVDGSLKIPPGRGPQQPDDEAGPEQPESDAPRAISAPADRDPNGESINDGPPVKRDASPQTDDSSNDGPPVKRSALEDVHDQVKDVDPDHAAKVLDASSQTGTDPAYVNANLPEVQKAMKMPSAAFLQALEDGYPGTTKWLTDPNNMAVSRDDLPNLAQHEAIVQRYSAFQSLGGSFISGLLKLGSDSMKIPALLNDFGGLPRVGLHGIPDLSRFHLPTADWLRDNQFTQFFDSNARDYRPPELDSSIVEQIGKGDMPGAVKSAAAQFIATVPATTALVAGTLTGLGAPALLFGGLQTAAGSEDAALKEGKDPTAAVINAGVHGVAMAAAGHLQMGVLKHWESAIAQSFGKAVSKEFFLNLAKTMAWSTGNTAVQQSAQSFAEDFSDYVTGINPDAMKTAFPHAINAGIIGGMTGLVMTGPAAITSGISVATETRHAENARDMFTAMGDTAEASKIRERSTPAFKEAMDTVTDGTPAKDILIPVEAFDRILKSKNIPPALMAEKLGVGDSYREAQKGVADGNVSIPLSSMLSEFAGSPEFFQAFKDDVKTDSERLTVNQVKERQAEWAQKIQAEEAARQKAQEEGNSPQGKPPPLELPDQGPPGETAQNVQPETDTSPKIYDEKYLELREAGRSKAEARAGALIHQKFFETLAAKQAETSGEPADAYKIYKEGYPLGVRRANAPPTAGEPTGGEQQPGVSAEPEEGETDYYQDNVDDNQKKNGKVIDARHLFRNAPPASGAWKLKFTNDKGEKVTSGFNTKEDAEQWIANTEKVSPGFINDHTLKRSRAKAKPLPTEPTMAEKFAARFGNGETDAQKAIADAQNPKEGPYVSDKRISGIGWAPNYEAEPTGDIGPERISKPHETSKATVDEVKFLNKEIDPLNWSDRKWGATLQLIQKHKDAGIPLTINTSSDLVAADDYIAAMPKDTTVNMHMLTSDDQLNRILFPGNASRLRQEIAVEELEKAGIKVNAIEPTAEGVIKAVSGGKKAVKRMLGEGALEAIEKALKPETTENSEKLNNVVKMPQRDAFRGSKEGVGEGEAGKVLNIDRGERAMTKGELENIRAEIDEIKKANELADTDRDADVLENNGRRLDELIAALEGAHERAVSDEQDRQINETRNDLEAEREKQSGDLPTVHDGRLKAMRDAEPPPMRHARFGTAEGNLWITHIEKDGKIIKGIGPDKATAKEAALAGGTPYQVSEASEAILSSPWQNAVLVVGSNNYLRQNAPFFVLQEYDLHLMLRPQSGEHWELGLAMLSRNGRQDKFVSVKNRDIEQGLKDLVGAATAESTSGKSLDSPMDRDVDEPERKATDAKKSVWTTQAIYRKAKISLKDVLHLEPYSGDTKSFFQGGDNTGEGEGPRGRIRINESGALIDLFRSANKSTFLHESGHYFLDVIGKVAAGDDAPAEIKQDHATILKWLGADSTDAITSEQHEKFARGFEAYLMEGKAPSSALRRVFDRFRGWLTSIYGSVKSLNVELTPEIRGVMDRMLATRDEIKRAQDTIGFKPEIPPGVPESVVEGLDTLHEQAISQAENALLREQMGEISEKNQAFLKTEREKATVKAEAEVKDLPLYRAMSELTKEQKRDATAMAHGFLDDQVTDRQAAAFETKAAEYDFDSGLDLARKIVADDASNGRAQEVKMRVDRAMEPHAAMKDTDAIRLEAMKQIHSERMTELLALEHEALLGLVHKATISQEASRRNRAEASIAAEEVKKQAQEILSKKPVKEAGNPKPYITAERNAAVKVSKALAAKDYELAAEAKGKQMLNHALAAEAMRNQARIEKSVSYLKDIAARGPDLTKKVPYAFNRQVEAILSRFDLAARPQEDVKSLQADAQVMLKHDETPDTIANKTGYIQDADTGQWRQETLADLVKRVNAANYGLVLPPSVFAGIDMPHNQMSLPNFRDLEDAVKALMKVGSKYNQFISFDSKVDIDTAGKAAAAALIENIGAPMASRMKAGYKNQPPGERLLGMLGDIPRWFNRNFDTMLTTVSKFDGIKNKNGPWKECLWRPLAKAENDRLARIRDEMKNLDDVFARHYDLKDLDDMKNSFVPINAEGRRLSKYELLAMAMNWGNAEGRDRIMRGEGLEQHEVEKLLFTNLTKRDFDFVQDGLNFVGSFKPELHALQMEIKGFAPKWIDPLPMHTPFGDYAGGYYPLDYDPQRDATTFKHQEENQGGFKQYTTAKASTEGGFLKERVPSLKRPLRYSFDAMTDHVEDAVKRLTYQKAVIDVSRFLGQKDVKAALLNAVGPAGYRAMTDWINAVADEGGPPMGGMDQFARWFRFRTTFSYMAYRLASAPKIFGENVNNLVSEAGFTGAARAIGQYYSDRGASHNLVISKSEFMRQRAEHLDRDMGDITDKWSGQGASTLMQKYTAFAFWTHAFLDQTVSHPLWVKTYTDAMSGGKENETEAIHLADEAVRRTFMAGGTMNQAAAMRGGEAKKALTTAMGYQSMMFNRYSMALAETGQTWRAGNKMEASFITARAHFFTFVVPVAISILAAEMLHNSHGDNEDEEEEQKTKRRLSTAIEEGLPTKFIPVIRDAVPYFMNRYLGEHGRDLQVTPMERAAQTIMEAGADSFDYAVKQFRGEPGEFPMENVAKSISLVTPIPQSLNDRVFNFLDWQKSDGEETWKDFTRDFVVGKRRTKK